jgi:hypothetical protein
MNTEEKNIQHEVAKIHGQYGVTEMANYKIEQLFEYLLKKKSLHIPTDEELSAEALRRGHELYDNTGTVREMIDNATAFGEGWRAACEFILKRK